jgi:hypothetical protein
MIKQHTRQSIGDLIEMHVKCLPVASLQLCDDFTSKSSAATSTTAWRDYHISSLILNQYCAEKT